jgi:hypothetical protein
VAALLDDHVIVHVDLLPEFFHADQQARPVRPRPPVPTALAAAGPVFTHAQP